MAKSLELGEIVPVSVDAPPTLCDALQTPRVSPITFGILRERASAALSVTDAEVKDAVRWAWDKHELVVEPGGAMALAALLSGKRRVRGRNGCRAFGGNVDPALHAEIVSGEA